MLIYRILRYLTRHWEYLFWVAEQCCAKEAVRICLESPESDACKQSLDEAEDAYYTAMKSYLKYNPGSSDPMNTKDFFRRNDAAKTIRELLVLHDRLSSNDNTDLPRPNNPVERLLFIGITLDGGRDSAVRIWDMKVNTLKEIVDGTYVAY